MKIKLIKDFSGRIIATNVEDDEADYWDDEDRQEIEDNHLDYSMAFDLVMGGEYDKALKVLFELPLGQWVLLPDLYAQVNIQFDENLADIYVCWLNDVRETEYKLVGFFHDKDLFSQIVIRLNKLNCI